MLLRLFSRWQVRGRENVPDKGALLIVSNHLHLADPPLVSVSLKRKAIFMAKEELFRSKFTGYFISSFGAFPVHRGQLDRNALRQAERVLAEGLALVMFPEAARSKNAQLQPAFPGSALIALRNGVPVLPVAITGTERIKGFWWIFHRPTITITFGQPFHLSPASSKISRTVLNDFTDYIMVRIAELLPKEYQGYYVKQREPDVIKD
jgi:1-acyl-sn-glycerol-3-phosphate acyltransferase